MPLQISLKARALRYLAMREHSRVELQKKLKRYQGEHDNLEALLDQLEQQGYLSNDRFTESFLRRQQQRLGNARILHDLQQHQLNDEQLSKARKELSNTEFERALGVWQRKYHIPPGDSDERLKQMRFLQQRGFSFDTINAVMKQVINIESEKC